ncbi:hypothetical protein HYW18_03390 [Candidatus Uhrbacteria bacterium]|nr:hypothetical protein [Candidatus Uhrbacteria bacterium]
MSHMTDQEETSFEPEPGFGEEPVRAGEGARTELVLRILRHAKEAMQNAIDLLESGTEAQGRQILVELLAKQSAHTPELARLQAEKVVEGVFDGEQMIGSDGQSYVVPPNYASKSRLVEGDILKLTIRADGTFLYKQVGPIERRRLQASLAWDASANGYVAIDESHEHVWKVLTASVTFFKGQEGDQIIVLVPKNTPSTWAAVENVIRQAKG